MTWQTPALLMTFRIAALHLGLSVPGPAIVHVGSQALQHGAGPIIVLQSVHMCHLCGDSFDENLVCISTTSGKLLA